MAADRLVADIRGCCPRNEPEQTASCEKLMLYFHKLDLHEWRTTISPILVPVPRTPPANTPVCNETHKRKEGNKGRESEREVFARLTVLDCFQGYCQSLWRFGKEPLQFNSSVVPPSQR